MQEYFITSTVLKNKLSIYKLIHQNSNFLVIFRGAMSCDCTNTAPADNAQGKCITPCSDYPLLTCGNSGGKDDISKAVYSVYKTGCKYNFSLCNFIGISWIRKIKLNRKSLFPKLIDPKLTQPGCSPQL
jgi:hypothetical protein